MQVQKGSFTRPRRWPRWSVFIAAVAVAVVVAGCGGSSKESTAESEGKPAAETTQSSSAASSASAATGTPIKTMTIAPIHANGPVFPNIGVTAETYAKWINAHGGINGHPLEVSVCNDRDAPTTATECARKAVEEKDVSVVGSYSFEAESIVPVLEKAKITWFGECCAGTPSELTSKYSFPVGSSLMYAVGEVKRAVQDKCKGINAVIVDGAQPYIPPMENAMKALGEKFVTKPIIVPATIGDDSALVAKATSKAECLAMVLDETLFKPWLSAMQEAGDKTRLYGPQGNLDAVSIKGFESVTNGDIIVGAYPDLSTEPWSEYREALASYEAPEEYDYNSLGGMGTWAGYKAFQQVAEAVEGEITATSFYEAAAKTTELNLNGMVPPIDFTKEWTNGLKGYQRLFNRGVVYSEVKNGKIVPLTTEFEDMSSLAVGKKA